MPRNKAVFVCGKGHAGVRERTQTKTGAMLVMHLEWDCRMDIRQGMQPGDLGSVIHLHGTLYGKEYDLDHTFEGHVAAGMGEFAKQFDPNKDLFLVAEDDGQIVGSIAINGLADQTAQLRWFLLHPSARGAGLGKRLLGEALDFCRKCGFKSVSLWTISELKTAAHLYRQAGFTLIEEKTHDFWGGVRTEQKYNLSLECGDPAPL